MEDTATIFIGYRDDLTEEELRIVKGVSYTTTFIISQECDKKVKEKALEGLLHLMAHSGLYTMTADYEELI